METKLLHERLRDMAECNVPMIAVMVHYDTTNESELLKRFADEIERTYIPRPRFEDGEPVQFDGEVEGCNGPVYAMLIFRDGSGYVYGKEDNPHSDPLSGEIIEYGLKRPAPKVPDADGVAIKAGDTVWSQSGVKGTVKGVNADAGTAYVEWDDGRWSPAILCVNLTHREPDSLKRLRDDIAEWRADVAIPGNGWDIKTAEWCDRLTALIERGM